MHLVTLHVPGVRHAELLCKGFQTLVPKNASNTIRVYRDGVPFPGWKVRYHWYGAQLELVSNIYNNTKFDIHFTNDAQH